MVSIAWAYAALEVKLLDNICRNGDQPQIRQS